MAQTPGAESNVDLAHDPSLKQGSNIRLRTAAEAQQSFKLKTG